MKSGAHWRHILTGLRVCARARRACSSAPSATAGAPPYSSAAASMGSSLRCATGAGRPGSAAGRRLKNRSFSALSLTASDSRNAIVSTRPFFSAGASASRAGFSRRLGWLASSRW